MNTVTNITGRTLSAFAFVTALSLSSVASAQIQRVGNPYTPSGANYSITATQDINASNPLGNTSGAQVNLNYEMTPSIGVTYNQGGKLKDFGIGLYSTSKSGPIRSTGLMIQYASLIAAYSANLVVQDFDLKSGATAFNVNKVVPAITLYGENNQKLGTANASQIFAAMVAQPNQKDVWNINLGSLLSRMNVSAVGVSKVLLYADSSAGEKPSDPYLLRSVGNAQPVPEPTTMCTLAVGAILLRRKRKATA